MAGETLAAVITGDVISSSKIKGSRRKRLLKTMEEAFQHAKSILPDFQPELFQGDSFQGFTIQHTPHALRTSLYLILQLRVQEFGLRVSLGMGTIDLDTGTSLTSDGSAFRESGRNMELLKKNSQVIAIAGGNENLQGEWNVHSNTLSFLLKRCSPLQAAALVQMLENKTQQEAAEKLKVKQPAIQQRLQAAGWPVFQPIISRFEMQF